jgi:tetratricopeptide (TPR) repeat protein
MCTDPSVYELDDYWKSQGMADLDQVRHEVLWQAARNGEVPIHTGKCVACAELLASFERMVAVLGADGPVAFAVCPDAAAFSRYYYGEKDPAIEDHVKVCTACREDLAFMARSQEPRDKTLPLKRRMMWLAAAAAALVFTLLPWPWKNKHEMAKHVFQQSSEYAALAQPPVVDRAQLMAVSAPDHHSRIDKVIELYDKGDYKTAQQYADVIYRAVDDPAAAYLLGMAQYKQGNLQDALESMRTSEAMQPASEYRCWGALQFALMLGDKATIKRELNHLHGDNAYGDRCLRLQQELQQRGFI